MSSSGTCPTAAANEFLKFQQYAKKDAIDMQEIGREKSLKRQAET
jgi:hypothetical protein